MTGLTSAFESPQYATPIGLIRYAQRMESERPQLGAFARLREKFAGLLSGSARMLGIMS
jgi:cell division protein FtsA